MDCSEQIKDALEWFEYFSHPEMRWSIDRMYATFTRLDEDYDFSDCDITPLKQKMLKHRDQILAEVNSINFIQCHRSDFNIPPSHIWWYLDTLEYIPDLPDPEFDPVADALTLFKTPQNPYKLWKSSDLLHLFYLLDGYDFTNCDTAPIKEALIKVYHSILNPWIDLDHIKRYRYKSNISKSRFWWWFDLLLIPPEDRHKI